MIADTVAGDAFSIGEGLRPAQPAVLAYCRGTCRRQRLLADGHQAQYAELNVQDELTERACAHGGHVMDEGPDEGRLEVGSVR